MRESVLNAFYGLRGVALVPMSIERFSHDAELDDEIAGEVLQLDFAAFLAPEAAEGRFVVAHDNPGVRAADETLTSAKSVINPGTLEREGHDALQISCSRISSAALRIAPSASADKSRNSLSR
jgi:hypothetical protein